MGCGTAVRSPIRSSMRRINSTSRPGTDFSIFPRTSSMTSSMPRRGWGFRRTKKSPSLASVRHAAELQARAAGVGLDLGRLAEDLLDLAQQAVGLGQRRAGRRDVVEDEAALVHLRHEAGARVRRRPRSRRRGAAARATRIDPRGAAGPRRIMAARRRRVHGGRQDAALLLGRVLCLQQPRREQRHRQPGHEVRDDQAGGHRQRQRLEERAGHARQERQRRKDDDGRGGGAGQGLGELGGRRRARGRRGRPCRRGAGGRCARSSRSRRR